MKIPMPKLSPTQIARFWSKVDVGMDVHCWPWKGARNPRGYGSIRVLDVTYASHRIAYELGNGPVPDGKCVCHHCDTPSCVNPAHLFLGTIKENVQDAMRKGRFHARPPSLTPEEKSEVVRETLNGVTARELAARFNVSLKTIGRCRRDHAAPHPHAAIRYPDRFKAA
jgi:hypothetical protein